MKAHARDILRLSDVQVRIAGSHILQGIDFAVAAGGVTAVLGRNGVGKTTTLKAILGLVPSTGAIELDGVRIDGTPTHRIVRSGAGSVPEDREVFAMLTVQEGLKLAEIPGVEPDYDTVHELFPELLERRRQRAGTLSGGQQQMVAPARVLLGPTRLLLVDEPTKGWHRNSSPRSATCWLGWRSGLPCGWWSRTSLWSAELATGRSSSTTVWSSISPMPRRCWPTRIW